MVHKDRQDPISVIVLSSEMVIDFLTTIGYVSTTIIPELDDYTTINVAGMYPHPHDVCVGKYGFFYFLSYNAEKQLSSLYRAQPN